MFHLIYRWTRYHQQLSFLRKDARNTRFRKLLRLRRLLSKPRKRRTSSESGTSRRKTF
jgi:hypothetical protein